MNGIYNFSLHEILRCSLTQYGATKSHIIEPHYEKTCLKLYANNKDADQPTHPQDQPAHLYLLYPTFQESN